MNPCTIGILLDQANESHKLTKPRQKGLVLLTNLDHNLKQIYLWRAGLDTQMEIKAEDTICFHHEKIFGQYFTPLVNPTKCLDVFKKHVSSKKKPKGVHEITLKYALYLKTQKTASVPGYKLCRNCWMHLNDSIKSTCVSSKQLSSSAAKTATGFDSCDEVLNSTMEQMQSLKRSNQVLDIIGELPIKLQSKTSAKKFLMPKTNFRQLQKT